LFSNTLNLCFPLVRDTKFHIHRWVKIIVFFFVFKPLRF
jgi:hypothetical protein